MRRIVVSMLLLQLALSARAGDDGQPATPAEQYRALLKDYEAASGGGASSDAARKELIARTFRLRHGLALKLLDLAERHPEDPVAVDALIQAAWQVNTEPWPVGIVGATDGPGLRALVLLQRDHVASEKLGTVCERVSYGYCKEYEAFLRAVLEKSPHRDVRGVACLALGRFLCGRLQRFDLVQEDQALVAEFEALFGKEYVEGLRRRSREEAGEEAAAVLEQAAKRFPDVKALGGGTVGEKAEAALFEFRHLRVGREAPDIEGVDQDGKRFKLSDYRGKVVLLDFWHQY